MLKTKRLILRCFTDSEKDIMALLAILSDKEVNKFLPWFPLKNREETLAFYHERIVKGYEEGEGFYFAICQRGDDTPIGYVAVSGDQSHDFGYGLIKEFWNQGIVTEATSAVLDFLKTRNWAYITATHDVHNPASGEVMKKIGLTYRYSYKEQWQPKNKLVTFRMYQLNLDGKDRTYQSYWELYPEHFIEEIE